MTDKHDGLLDIAQHAVRMERLEGQQALLAQRVSQGMDNVASTLASVQVEVRGLATRIGEVGALQHSHDTSRDAVYRRGYEILADIPEGVTTPDDVMALLPQPAEYGWTA